LNIIEPEKEIAVTEYPLAFSEDSRISEISMSFVRSSREIGTLRICAELAEYRR
jgi:hypothetical protein